ncbi:hypothetical protein D7Y42_03800 [Stenotrophomonas maltophilia]|uniref:hypothetical protein n=1 Tax=Stenotrophomonas TaxID=40323 RepID=UPI0015DEFD9E|nr:MULTISPECIES: hypothetical protein [Stenotrophomonas]EKT4081818.1 hypothetical protein [Stenotrophomonas maltophilia]MBA0369837.1 hypothetical protein [Stenotrophomonas maltophilia]
MEAEAMDSISKDPWQEMFPLNEARQATEFLVTTWHVITKERPDRFSPGKSEPVLTELFWWHLDQTSTSVGRLTGQWSYERSRTEIDQSTNKATKRIRLDITYFSNAQLPALDMVYEFKKLSPDSASRGKYRGVSGLRRFVDGNYAKHQPIAAMVGMTLKDRASCISKIASDLTKSTAHTSLAMVANGAGMHVCSPSQIFAAHAEFDTEHVRPASQAWKGGNIRVAHIFLPLPGCT